MGITIYHINIRNWNKNKYPLSVDITNYNPEVILLNETGAASIQQLKLQGYNCTTTNNTAHHGATIFIKENIIYEVIPTYEEGTIAVKILTNFGYIIISTIYCPPRTIIIIIIGNYLAS